MTERERSGERERPDPEGLLDRYQLREQATSPTPRDVQRNRAESGAATHGRGRLRIYLGMAAGVGKTYAMLNEGRRRKARGTDVVIGYVEVHKRPLTEQQIGELEIVPRKRITYRGVMLEEMDVDAVIARRPTVALVDELAHTNAPGSRNAKRYQDVEELLAAGITVITTVNIQHLEGLNDVVEAITGVRQRETLPDSVLDTADEIELIDIAPDALRARLRHGNVYPPERAQRALEHYFSLSNLTALRELALRRTAEKAEAQLEGMMRGKDEDVSEAAWASTATERVMVAFDARPHARQLLRDGWRLARGLKAPLLAVTIVRPSRRLGRGAVRESAALKEHLRLAEDLGAEVIQREGCNVAETLAAIAHERHVTQIVIGQPTRGMWSERFGGGSVVNRLLRLPTGADIHVAPQRGQH
ncbi:MAG: Osmosensitive K+ channel histidine kinase KdpD [Ktedonobacterales bacterium]|jgi:two-component system sensor histidine kinase KdpD|nr:MAG: Osmosensitive K+ channel histidine kinase KdpD [Ktedonobacterales bacterium]